MRKPTEFVEKSIPRMPNAMFVFYVLQSLERAGHLSGIAQFGKLDWKADATKRLLETQQPNGSWKGSNAPTSENEIIATGLALMALTGQPERPREHQLRIEPRDKDQPIKFHSERIENSSPPRQRTVISGGVRIEVLEPDGLYVAGVERLLDDDPLVV